MRAAVMRRWELVVDDVPEPRPGAGQVLVDVLACGICGSDLGLLHHGQEQVEFAARLREGRERDPLDPVPADFERDVVMGHEYVGEVVELGPGCERLAVGDRVVSMPVNVDAQGLHGIGFSDQYPGGYAERMVLTELVALTVPNGLDTRTAALTEPYAVGVHAVAKAGIAAGQAALVLGCGPVGLACIADLRRIGVEAVVAADPSPRRRQLALALGATEAVDPAVEPAVEAWRRLGSPGQDRGVVVFEATGKVGMIDQAMLQAPKGAGVLVVGACMQQDVLHPMLGLAGELTIRFALGYQPPEFEASLRALSEGVVDLSPMLTGSCDIDGVPGAFQQLRDPEAQAKILVEPTRT